MLQTRLYLQAGEAEARRLFALAETAFEEDGLPISTYVVDEERGIHELSIYCEDDPDPVEQRLARLAAEAAPGSEVKRETLEEVDWVSRSLEGLKPVRVGRFLVHGAHDRHRRRPADIAIEIEAGQAFGTGHHGTTSGCLEMIERIVASRRPRRMLDLGTGSGVLAIALARLTRRRLLATDIDPVAIEVARRNARLNRTTEVEFAVATGFGHNLVRARAPYDLIVANILARPLMKLAPDMKAHLAPGGSLVLSGILERQRQAVVAAYVSQGFRHLRTLHRAGWVTLHLAR